MFFYLYITSILVKLSNQYQNESLSPAENQLLDYVKTHPNVHNTLTTSYGTPVSDPQNILTAGPRGPALLQDTHFLEVMQSMNREKIPQRVMHGKGAGAFGYFEVTNDITMYTKASVFSKVGKKTNVATRFSNAAGESGSADSVRDMRGIAVKFYTDDGIWDLLGLNVPAVLLRDPILFPQLLHANTRNPQTHLHDNNAKWDFLSNRPEMILTVMYVNSALGIPANYRAINGYSVNAFRLVNTTGHAVYAKFYWKTEQGVANMSREEAAERVASHPDYYIEDLFNEIAAGNFPKWTLHIQVMTMDQAKNFMWNPLDPTKEWPQDEFALIPVGELVLNTNPKNYFVDVEMLGFSPGRLVPGIEPSPDKLLQGRLFVYPDAQIYRLGINHNLLKVNRPYNGVHNYERDGFGRYDDNQGNAPTYYPNSFNGPKPSPRGQITSYSLQGDTGRYDTSDDDNYSQPRMLWQRMNTTEKQELVENLVATLSKTYPGVQQRVLERFYQISEDLATRMARSLKTTIHS